jgi:hypothetical protein
VSSIPDGILLTLSLFMPGPCAIVLKSIRHTPDSVQSFVNKPKILEKIPVENWVYPVENMLIDWGEIQPSSGKRS